MTNKLTSDNKSVAPDNTVIPDNMNVPDVDIPDYAFVSDPSEHDVDGPDISDQYTSALPTDQWLQRRARKHKVNLDMSATNISENAINRFFDRYTHDELKAMSHNELTHGILSEINNDLRAYNATLTPVKGADGKMHKPKAFEYKKVYHEIRPADLHLILSKRYIFVNLFDGDASTDPEHDMLAFYDEDETSDTYGLYINIDLRIRRLAQQLSPTMTDVEFKNLLNMLRASAPRRARRGDRDLIAVNNGIFDYHNKRLLDFDSKYVFVSKSAVKFNPDATNPVFTLSDGTKWDVESWVDEIMQDGDGKVNPAMSKLIWQIIGATLRPYVSWNKSAWFFSTVGNNGKGTLLRLMRNIVGSQAYTSLKLTDFGREFMLEPLLRAQAILTDENDVGTFIDRGANLKSISTNDPILINRKNRVPINYRFFGFMVQCLNEEPRVRDKSESFYRRQLFVPFEKSFTGREHHEIKDEFMSNPQVLEYVVKKVLLDMPDYYEIETNDRINFALNRYKVANDPLRAFWEDMKDEFVWDALPFKFLHALYLKWFALANPNGKPLGYNTFITDLKQLMPAYGDEWVLPANSQYKFTTGTLMDESEPLIRTYNLDNWMSMQYRHGDDRRYRPVVQKQYNGLLRVKAFGDTIDANDPANPALKNNEPAEIQQPATQTEQPTQPVTTPAVTVAPAQPAQSVQPAQPVVTPVNNTAAAPHSTSTVAPIASVVDPAVTGNIVSQFGPDQANSDGHTVGQHDPDQSSPTQISTDDHNTDGHSATAGMNRRDRRNASRKAKQNKTKTKHSRKSKRK